tara:strand:+ start:76 stop:513 length:438 start_codon:yes stop_codon:yes gene_type:complete
MSCTFSQLRAAVATKVAGVSGFKLTRFPPGYFARMQNTIAHKAFLVNLRSSQDAPERQRRAGIYLNTTVEVEFAFRLRPKDVYPTDYDTALNAEEDVIRAVLSSYNGVQPGVEIRYNRSSRQVVDTLEYQIHNIEFTARHVLPNT